MHVVHKVLALVALLAGLLVAPLVVAGPASAAPLAAAASCPTAAGYPPLLNGTVSINTTDVLVGQTVEVSGANFCADEDVAITVNGKQVATGHTDAQGSFDPPVKLTDPGSNTLCAVGASGLDDDRDCLTVAVKSVAGAVSSGSAGAGSSGSGSGASGESNGAGELGSTGVAIAALSGVALLLVTVGGLFLYVGRRRRQQEPIEA